MRWHSTLHTPHLTLHTLHSTLYTSHFTLHTLHSTLYTPHYASLVHTLHSTLYTFHPTAALYTPHSTIPTLHSTHCIFTQQSTFFAPHTLHSTLFCIPQSTVHWYRNRGKMHKTVQLTCFTQVFYVTAFGFVGCILFSFFLKFGLVLVLWIHEIVQAIESECDLKDGHMAHGWHMDGTWMAHGWHMDGTWMAHGWDASKAFQGSHHAPTVLQWCAVQVYNTPKQGQEIVALIKGDVFGGEHVPVAWRKIKGGICWRLIHRSFMRYSWNLYLWSIQLIQPIQHVFCLFS